jgi:hypothetical protein
MESKSGNLHVNYIPFKKAGGIAVLVSWSCEHSKQSALNDLMCCKSCNDKALPHTALNYAMAQGVENILLGSPVDASKNQISSIVHNSLNKHYSICYCAKGTRSTLRKTLGLTLKALQPLKYVNQALNAIKECGQKLSKEGMNQVVNDVNSCLGKGIHVVIIGKMGTTQEQLDTLVGQVSPKMAELKKPTGKMEKPVLVNESSTESKENVINVKGLDLIYLSNYLHSRLGTDIESTNDGIICPLSLTDSKKSSLKNKDSVERFVSSKYEKLGNEMKAAIFYYGAVSNKIDAVSLNNSGNITAANIVSSIIKHL